MPKHALRLGLAIAGVLVLAIGAGGSSAAEPEAVKRVSAPASIVRAEPVTDQVIVRFKAGTTAAERRDALSDESATVDETLPLARMQVVDLPADTEVAEAVAAFEANPDVAYAEPNFTRAAMADPNDADYSEQWGMPKISAPAAWDLDTGSASVVVAVIDTGVAYDHPDLAPNIWTNDDAAGGGDNDGNGFVDDTHGWDFVQDDAAPLDFYFHGTHVAGTIGAKGNNALGVAGVNWDVSLMPVRAGDFNGSFSSSDTIAAYTYACQNGARVVNGSFGGPGFSQAELDAINSPACEDTLFVFAAGNGGADGVGDNNDVTPMYPCSYGSANIVCVAASDPLDARATFSNYGATTVDLAAPGTAIHSTIPRWAAAGQLESFEDPGFGGRWGIPTTTASPGPLWGRTTDFKSAQTYSFTDSPGLGINYANNAVSQVVQDDAPIANLTGKRGCFLQYDLKHDIRAGDSFRIYGGTTNVPAAMNTEIVSLWSNPPTPGIDLELAQDELSMFDGAAAVYLKLQLVSDNDLSVGDGVYLDAMSAVCLDPGEEYLQLDGTSMAAPHVSGVAALMLARNPLLTTTQLRTILLATTDPVPAFTTSVATGGRLNARAAVEAAVLPPAPTITDGPSGSVSSTDATFVFTFDADGVECRLDGALFAPCVSPVAYTALAQGSHTFDVRATSVAGPSPTTSRTWIVDTIDPVPPTIDSGPPNFVSSTSATLTFSNVESGLTFECSLDAGAFAECTSPASYTGLAETAHTLDVRATDAAGNMSGTASRGWTVSLVDTPTIDTGPSGAVASTGATFGFSDTEGGVTLECRLDGAPFAVCVSPVPFTGLAQGAHTFEVHAVNGVGSVSDPALRTWTVDTIDPVAPTIDSGPSGLIASTGAVFAFSNVESGLDFECSLDGGSFAPCVSPVDLTPVGQGAHTFQIQAKDAAGNTSSAASRTWTADTIAPATPTIDDGPAGTVASTGADFEFTGEEIVECRLDAAPFDVCASPVSFTSLAQGAHTFDLRAKDAADNTSVTASRTWTVDTVAPPVPTIDSGPNGFVSSLDATFAFSDTEAGAILECRLDADPFATCTSPALYSGLAQGEHTFDVRAKDSVENTSAVVSRTWTADTLAPPVPTIDSGPTGTVASTGATFAFSDSEPGVTIECRLDTAAFAVCASPVSYTGLTQGAHSFEVRASDAAGNTATASQAWSVDTVAPPVPTIDSGPSGTVTLRDADFVFTDAEVGATLECKLDGAAFEVCTSPVSFTNLDYGSHTFQVLAKDALANTSAAVSRTWIVTPPVPTFDSGPSGTMITTAAAFAFSGAPGVTLECRLDGASFATCTSPVPLSGLADGAHTFEVRSTKDGVPSLPAARTWTVTTAAPSIATGPAASVSSATADFTFSHTATGLTFECRVDTDPFAACASPAQFTSLAEGARTFDVRAKDAVGNTSPAASRAWVVDMTAPPIPGFVSGPSGTVKTTAATFAFSSTEGGVTFECSLDGAAFATCASPRTLPGLAQGAHSFQVQAKDAAGNASAAVSRAWSVDTVKPNTTISSGPPKTTKATTATLKFAATEVGSTFKCKLDKAGWATCKSPKAYKKLKKGSHTFQVVATDKAGNLDATPAKKTWKIK